MLSTIEPQSQTDALAERLRRRLQTARLADGELFMTEAQLMAKYRVSRSVAREAVGRLCALGILEGRQRKGLIARRPDPLRLLARSLPMLASSPDDLRELARLRYVLELGAIELAVKNATAQQIDQLQKLTGELTRALRRKAPEAQVDELDVAFHSLILEMTGSAMVAGMQRVVADFFRLSARDQTISRSSNERIIWQHHELADAIRDRDLDRARAMLRVHFQELLKEPPSEPKRAKRKSHEKK